MGAVKGTGFKLYIKIATVDTPIPLEIDSNLTVNNETIDVTSKDDGDWLRKIAGDKSWEVSGTFRYDQDDTVIQGIIDNMLGDTVETEVVWGKITDVGDVSFTGKAVATGFELAATRGEVVDIPLTFEGTEALTKVVKSA